MRRRLFIRAAGTNIIWRSRLTPSLHSPTAEKDFIFDVDFFSLLHLPGTSIAETQVNEEGSCNNQKRCG
jgi:hypothetical protein